MSVSLEVYDLVRKLERKVEELEKRVGEIEEWRNYLREEALKRLEKRDA